MREFEERAALLVNHPVVLAAPPGEIWALREALADADSLDDLPERLRGLLDERLLEALDRFEERLHPRDRRGRFRDVPGVAGIFQYHFSRVWANRHKSPAARDSARQLVRAMKAAKARGEKPDVGAPTSKAMVTEDRPYYARRLTPDDLNTRQMTQFEARDYRARLAAGRELPFAIFDGRNDVTVAYPAAEDAERRALEMNDDYERRNREERERVAERKRLYGEGLLRGEPYKDGKGRRGLRRSAKGWREQVEKARTEGVLPQGKLTKQWWEAIKLRTEPDLFPDAVTFIEDWGGKGLVPGKYERGMKKPGYEFEKQHRTIMEAGARIDAEIKRRLKPKVAEIERVRSERNALRAEVRRLAKVREEKEYEALAVQLGTTVEDARSRRLALLRAQKRLRPTELDRRILHDDMLIWDMWENRYNVEGVDVQAAYDAEIEASHKLYRTYDGEPRDTANVEERRIAEARRDTTYEVLRELRPFGGGIATKEHESIVALVAVAAGARWLPSDWIEDSNRHSSRLVIAWENVRGRYSHNYSVNVQTGESTSRLAVSPSMPSVGIEENEAVALHELVHRSEDVRDGIKGAEWTFYWSRVSDPATGYLEATSELWDGYNGYDRDERARRDSFADLYCGKTYGDEMNSPYEILSMGVEDLATGRHGFIWRDEEYRQFVLGALATL